MTKRKHMGIETTEIDPRPGTVFEDIVAGKPVKNYQLQGSFLTANYDEIEERILAGLPPVARPIALGIEFEGPITPEFKRDLHAFMYGKAPAPTNYILILRGDDSGSQRHGGYRWYRSFVAYVNGQEVERWRDDEQRHDYSSGEYLDRDIAKWAATWEKALGCKAIRGEIKNRKRLAPERYKF